jgi:type VI protein secretion system component VasF
MCNVYLVAAYALLWGIFMFYAWVLQRRQQTLVKDLEELKRTPGKP